jgi:hypothetical protein
MYDRSKDINYIHGRLSHLKRLNGNNVNFKVRRSIFLLVKDSKICL